MKNLSVNQVHVLSSLISGEMYGLQLIKHIKECGGKMNIGSLYNLLNSLEKNGLIKGYYKESTIERKGNRRRYYKITALGESNLREIQYSFMKNNWKVSYA